MVLSFYEIQVRRNFPPYFYDLVITAPQPVNTFGLLDPKRLPECLTILGVDSVMRVDRQDTGPGSFTETRTKEPKTMAEILEVIASLPAGGSIALSGTVADFPDLNARVVTVRDSGAAFLTG